MVVIAKVVSLSSLSFFKRGYDTRCRAGALIGGGGSVWQNDGSFSATVNDIKQ